MTASDDNLADGASKVAAVLDQFQSAMDSLPIALDAHERLALSLFLKTLLAARSRKGSPPPSPSSPPSTVDRVSQFIREHYREDVQLKDAARWVRVSTYYLSRTIRQTTGLGFREHLHRVRLAAAHQLLSTQPLSVKEVAARVGYQGSTQLCRQFRRVYGFTPGQLLKIVSRRGTDGPTTAAMPLNS